MDGGKERPRCSRQINCAGWRNLQMTVGDPSMRDRNSSCRLGFKARGIRPWWCLLTAERSRARLGRLGLMEADALGADRHDAFLSGQADEIDARINQMDMRSS